MKLWVPTEQIFESHNAVHKVLELDLSLLITVPHHDVFEGNITYVVTWRTRHIYYKLKCCEFKGKQASKIESTSLCRRSYSVLHVRDQKNEWSVFVE